VKALLLAVVALLGLSACGPATSPPSPPATPAPTASPAAGSVPTTASDIATEYSLKLRGATRSERARLPRRLLASKAWANQQAASADIGLSLRPYRGQAVTLTSYRLADPVHGHPASLYIVSSHGALVGAFVALGEGSRPFDLEAPGIYSVREAAQL
jgi:hypothetical protein